jgi:hypothetical protein
VLPRGNGYVIDSGKGWRIEGRNEKLKEETAVFVQLDDSCVFES